MVKGGSSGRSLGLGPVCLAITLAVVLGGCIPESRIPHAEVLNRSERSVTLTLTGADVEPKEFPAEQGLSIWGADGTIEGRGICEGDGYVLTDTETGVVIATSDEPVCGETYIEINEDGTLD